jgi:hypothetical protein
MFDCYPLHRHLCAEEGEDPDDIRVLLCAPTGKAAYNIHGLTIHNAFQIQPNKGLDQSLPLQLQIFLHLHHQSEMQTKALLLFLPR